MGQVALHSPALLLLAAFSRHASALVWARERAAGLWGPPSLVSPPYAFEETDYYQQSMGAGLTKVFWAWDNGFDPAGLAELKRQTNAWEVAYAQSAGHAEPRPINLDPGYLTAAKLVLASTKDHAHRIYLEGGVYAEVTLHFRHKQWQPAEWTFPDYRRADYHQFFMQCRELLRQRERGAR